MTNRLYIEAVRLADIFNMQVRPREMHIRKLNLAVWAFNCIVACAPHLRQLQMNAETLYSVSGCSITSKPITRPGSSERGYRLSVTRNTVQVKRLSFQHWATEESIYFGTLGQAFCSLLLLDPQCSNSLQVPGTQVLNRQVGLSQSLSLVYCMGKFVFSYLARNSHLLVYRSKR